jgi:hypothetical protein
MKKAPRFYRNLLALAKRAARMTRGDEFHYQFVQQAKDIETHILQLTSKL